MNERKKEGKKKDRREGETVETETCNSTHIDTAPTHMTEYIQNNLQQFHLLVRCKCFDVNGVFHLRYSGLTSSRKR